MISAQVTIWTKERVGARLDWEISATLEGHENEVKGVAWNAGSTMLATCARDKSIWLWDLADLEFELFTVLHGHAADVKTCSFDCAEASPSYNDLASASYDDKIKLWTSDGGDDDWICYATLDGHESTVWDLQWLHSSMLLSASADHTIRFWQRRSHTKDDCVTYDNAATYPDAHGQWPIYSLDTAKSSTASTGGWALVATGGGDNAIRIFRLDPDTPGTPTFVPLYASIKAHTADVNCVRFHPTRPDLLASAGDDGLVHLWHLLLADSETTPR